MNQHHLSSLRGMRKLCLISCCILLLAVIASADQSSTSTVPSTCQFGDMGGANSALKYRQESVYSQLRNPMLNKGSSFSPEEKKLYRGLVPTGDSLSLDVKIEISMEQLRKKSSPLEKYLFLHGIQDSDETLFYGILTRFTKETMPLVYTPTVGQACMEWSHIYRQVPRGLYIGVKDVGHVKEILNNYPTKDIKVIVFTDGERILGLGDLGVNGMGIPIGKLALYTTCAGIHPAQCLPVTIDAGTNNKALLEDKAYLGLRMPRDRSPVYDALIEEFFHAVHDVYGRNTLVQFEDFGNQNAFRLLHQYQDKATCFNDDIQGTASVVLAGIIASLPLTKTQHLADHTYMFFGAGEAGIGIADLISMAIAKETGMSLEEAKSKCWFIDSKGLISKSRLNGKLEHHKEAYAHSLELVGLSDDVAVPTTLLESVKLVKPTVLIGVSTQSRAFTEDIVKQLASTCENPLIMALSNPTNLAECTASEAYTWTNGKAVFASGSPFDPVDLPDGRQFVPGQGNNAYIFPGVGLGALAADATKITDEDFLVAAQTLASLVTNEQLEVKCVYPDVKDLRRVSKHTAAAVAENIYKDGRGQVEGGHSIDWLQKCEQMMYTPSYN